MDPGAGMWLDGKDITTYGAFFGSILSAAKDWQDRLQSTLPGYRERIASIFLDDKKEGGLHLTMSKETIEALIGFGERAGSLMTGAAMSPNDRAPFDFDEHRWRRSLVAYDPLGVVLLHVWIYTGANAPDKSLTTDLWMGELRLCVLLFFVLSGFLLASPWVAAARGEREAPKLGRFMF